MLHQHLEKLRGFHAIAKEGSLLGAARVVGFSQPALTKSIKSLEEALGVRLFLRHKRGMALTDPGKELLVFCEKLFPELGDLEARLKAPEALSGVIQVGSFETLGLSFWPKILKEMQRTYPQLRIRIITDGSHTLWDRLDKGALHLIVDAEPQIRELYYSRVLYTDRFGLFARPGFKSKAVSPPFSYVRRAHGKDGKNIERYLRERKIRHELVYDLDTFISVKAAVAEGLCVGVLPLSLADRDLKSGRLEFFPEKNNFASFGEHRICATCLEDRRTDPRIIAILKMLTKK